MVLFDKKIIYVKRHLNKKQITSNQVLTKNACYSLLIEGKGHFYASFKQFSLICLDP